MFKFPYTNLHELNLDWILEKVKTLVANNDEFNEKADYAVETADEAKTIAEQAAQATIADGAVTTPKLADGAVTNLKIANGAINGTKIANGGVETRNIQDDAITAPKLDYVTAIASIPYTIAQNGTFHANLYTEAVSVLPSSYTPVAVIGFGTGNGSVFVINLRLVNDEYSLYVKNTYAGEVTGSFSATILALHS